MHWATVEVGGSSVLHQPVSFAAIRLGIKLCCIAPLREDRLDLETAAMQSTGRSICVARSSSLGRNRAAAAGQRRHDDNRRDDKR
jgi:hypothetical protein